MITINPNTYDGFDILCRVYENQSQSYWRSINRNESEQICVEVLFAYRTFPDTENKQAHAWLPIGADLLLDRLSLGYDKVEVDFSDVDSGSSIYRYHLIEHDDNGGTYTNGKETFWLCNVIHDVFDEHPKMLYINKVVCK